jgi:hypothetical protein
MTNKAIGLYGILVCGIIMGAATYALYVRLPVVWQMMQQVPQ